MILQGLYWIKDAGIEREVVFYKYKLVKKI